MGVSDGFSSGLSLDLVELKLECVGARKLRTNEKISFHDLGSRDVPLMVRVRKQEVQLLCAGTNVIERSFHFEHQVLDATFAYLDIKTNEATSSGSNVFISKKKRLRPRQKITSINMRKKHLCVLVRADCINVYTSKGDIFEVSLPFHARCILPTNNGLLVERSRDIHEDFQRPKLFTLSNPLDEVKPVTVSSDNSIKYFSDAFQDIVFVSQELNLLTSFNTQQLQYILYQMTKESCPKESLMVMREKHQEGSWKNRKKNLHREVLHQITSEVNLTEMWRSSPITPRSSSASSSSQSSHAFLALSTDLTPILCIMDRTAGILILNRLPIEKDDIMQSNSKLIECKNAVPVATATTVFQVTIGCYMNDIIVQDNQNQLILYREDIPLCQLVAKEVEMNNLQLHNSSHHHYFELQDFKQVYRFINPIQVMDPLILRIFQVFEVSFDPKKVAFFMVQLAQQVQTRCISEWEAFCALITSENAQSIDSSTTSLNDDPFQAMLTSDFHYEFQLQNPFLLDNLALPLCDNKRLQSLFKPATRVDHFDPVKAMECMHLLYEDLKLNTDTQVFCHKLVFLLATVAESLGFTRYVVYYRQEAISSDCLDELTSPNVISMVQPFGDREAVPDFFHWLAQQIEKPSYDQFPELNITETFHNAVRSFCSWSIAMDVLNTRKLLENPLWKTSAVDQLYKLLCDPEETESQVLDFLTTDPVGCHLDVEKLSFGLALPLHHLLHEYKSSIKSNASQTWQQCILVGREDLAGLAAIQPGRNTNSTSNMWIHKNGEGNTTNSFHDDVIEDEINTLDGLEQVVRTCQRLFPKDRRLKEVARLLRSNRPLCLKLEKTNDLSDQDFMAQQQVKLFLLCKRSMALPLARGMVTIGSLQVNASTSNSLSQTPGWRLSIPPLPLAGRTPPTNAIVSLDVSSCPKELILWPQFHNGVATALRLPARDHATIVNRYWIKYHRPCAADVASVGNNRNRNSPQRATSPEQELEERYASHAGLLFGLGLRGHLKCLSMADVYNYLSISNELVTVAVLLGMAATAHHERRKRKTQQESHKKKEPTYTQSCLKLSSQLSTISNVPQEEEEVEEQVSEDSIDPSIQPELDVNEWLHTTRMSTPLMGMGLELTLERSVSKMLCLHIPSLLPPPFTEFSVPANIQTAALLGLGILYQSSGHRLMTELLLAEITRSPSSSSFILNQQNANNVNGGSGASTNAFDQMEGYVLAAGLALGLVTLGRGRTTSGDPGIADLKLEEKLYKFMVGGGELYQDENHSSSNFSSMHVNSGGTIGHCLYRGRKWQGLSPGGDLRPRSSSGTSNDKQANQDRNWKGEHVNIGVTAHGSALALALMYLKSENRSVAAQLAVPDTLVLLEYVRPDLLLIRELAKNLVLWNQICPTPDWIEQQEVPSQLLESYQILQKQCVKDGLQSAAGAPADSSALPTHADHQTICEAYANIVAGACMSIGLRFAGTADSRAVNTLKKYVYFFRDMRSRSVLESVRVVTTVTTPDRVTIERCLAVCAQALALVHAGTGNLETLTLLRSINLKQRVDSELTYGNHMAFSMAIGLLFLGGGKATLSRSNEAIAALIISLYPIFPMKTVDNKHHLQAFRHLYVLAVDTSRLIETVEVTTGENCSTNLRALMKETNEWVSYTTPCLLPELDTVLKVQVESNEYYPVEIDLWEDCMNNGDPSANALREQLLREKNIILVKTRKKDPKFLKFTTLKDKQQFQPSSKRNGLYKTFANYFETEHTSEESFDWKHETHEVSSICVREQANDQLLWTHLNCCFARFQVENISSRSIQTYHIRNLSFLLKFFQHLPQKSLNSRYSTMLLSDEDRALRLRFSLEHALSNPWKQFSGSCEYSLKERFQSIASILDPMFSGVKSAKNDDEENRRTKFLGFLRYIDGGDLYDLINEWKLLSAKVQSQGSDEIQLKNLIQNQIFDNDVIPLQRKCVWLHLIM
jgi:hypothetical protein